MSADWRVRVCPECDRSFEIWSEPSEAEEWFFGHDCEKEEIA